MNLKHSMGIGLSVLSLAVSASLSAQEPQQVYLTAEQSQIQTQTDTFGNEALGTGDDFVSGEVLVRFKPQVFAAGLGNPVAGFGDLQLPGSMQSIFQRFGVNSAKSSLKDFSKLRDRFNLPAFNKQRLSAEKLSRWVKIKFDANQSVKNLIKELRADATVELAEPNYIVSVDMVPNDTYWGTSGAWGQTAPDLWGLEVINAESAWDTTQGSGVVVAVIDSGLHAAHPDIAANVWTNPNEIAGNGIDDDGNGYIDDVSGWDFVDGDAVPQDGHGHGTHVAGTIAAVGNNNAGIIGVAPQAKILPVKGLADSGSGMTSDLINALTYVADMGADVVNNSWSGVYRSQALSDAVDYAHSQGVVVVAAAGNDNHDAYYNAPAQIDTAITVGAIKYNNASSQTIAHFSNYGPKVDVFAPGNEILSLLAPGSTLSNQPYVVANDYVAINGTSMAAPHVAGAAALLLANDPTLSPEQVRNTLKATAADRGATGWDVVYGAGVIDVDAALSYSQNTARVVAGITSPSPFGDAGYNTLTSGTVSIEGNAKGANFQSYVVEYAPVSGGAPGAYTQITSGSVAVEDGVFANWDTSSLSDGDYVIRLTVTDTNGASSTAYQKVTKDSDLLPGWPKFLNYYGYSPQSLLTEAFNTMIIEDIDNDGLDEMVVSNFGKLYVIDNDGSSMFTATIGEGTGFANRNSPITVADLDNDGDKEIIYVTPRNISPSSSENASKILYARHHNGSLVSGFPAGAWPTADITSSYIVARSETVAPVVTDLENDGTLDIVFYGASWNTLYTRVFMFAVEVDGSAKPGFPIVVNDDYHRASYPPVIADFDADGDKEIAVLTPVYEPGSDPKVIDNLSLKVYGSDGLLEKSRSFANFIKEDMNWISGHSCSPKAADVNRDGKLELIIAKNSSINADAGNGWFMDLHVVDADLNDLNGFPLSKDDAQISCDFQATNLDADDELEIFSIAGAKVNAFNHDGSQVANYPNTISGGTKVGTALMYTPSAYSEGVFLASSIGWNSNGSWFNDLQANTTQGTLIGDWNKDIGVPLGTSLYMTQKDANNDVVWGMSNGAGMAYMYKMNIGSAGEGPTWVGIQGNAMRDGVVLDRNPVTPGTSSCTEFTATNDQHVTAGRATKEGTFFFTYYTVGSHESIGSYGWLSSTVAETSPGYFEKGNCPAAPAVAPKVQSVVAESANGSTTISGRAYDANDNLSSVEIEFDDNGTWITVTGTDNWSYTTTSLTLGQHTVKARAKDAGGLTSDERGPVSFEAVDPEPPEITWANTSAIVEDDVTFSGSVSDPDNDVVKVEVELNGDGNWLLATGTDSWTLDVTGLAVGTYDWVAKATDSSGLTDTYVGNQFTVYAPAAPECSIPEVSLDSAGYHYAAINATDVNNNLTTVEFRVDGGAWEAAVSGWGWFALLEDNPGDLSAGSHNIEGRVVDAGGLSATCGPTSFTVAAPAAPVINEVNFELLNNNAEVRIWGNSSDVNNDQTIAEVEFNDNGTWVELGEGDYFSKTFTDLAGGNYEARIRVLDYKGNISNESAPLTFTIAGVAGSAPSIDSVNASTNGLDVTVSGNVSDVDGDLSVVEVEFDNSGNWITATGTANYTYTATLSAGSHSVIVRATDAQNNQTLSSPTNFTLVAPSAPVVDTISVSVSGLEATVTGTASDVDGDLSFVEVEFDDSGVWTTVTGTTNWSYVTSSLSAGNHTVKARATDAGSLVSAETAAESFTLVAPSAPVVNTISVSVNGLEATVTGTASDADGDLDRVEVEFNDSGVWVTTTGTASYSHVTSSLGAGNHTVKARAVDQGGLYSAETAAESFTLVGSGNACFTDTVANHETAGRVYIANTLYYVTGSNTYLGSTYVNGGDVVSLEETSSGYWVTVTSCP